MSFWLYIHLSACLLVRAGWSGNFPTFLLLGPPVDVRGWSTPSQDLQRGLWAVSSDTFCHAFSDKIKLQFKGRLTHTHTHTHTHTLYQCSFLAFILYQYYNDIKCNYGEKLSEEDARLLCTLCNFLSTYTVSPLPLQTFKDVNLRHEWNCFLPSVSYC